MLEAERAWETLNKVQSTTAHDEIAPLKEPAVMDPAIEPVPDPIIVAIAALRSADIEFWAASDAFDAMMTMAPDTDETTPGSGRVVAP